MGLTLPSLTLPALRVEAGMIGGYKTVYRGDARNWNEIHPMPVDLDGLPTVLQSVWLARVET